mgnify:FL=1
MVHMIHMEEYMRLEISDNNGTKYIRIVESVRILKDGKYTTRKRIIKNIGPLSRFSDGNENYEERLKESFRSGNPLIAELLEYVPKPQLTNKHTFQITDYTDECIGHPKLFSHTLIERIMEELDIISVVKSYKGFSKLKFDVMGYLRLLIYGRILNPASKISTFSQNDDYFEPIIDDDYFYHIYDTLDFVHKYKKQIFNRINSSVTKKFQRQTNVIYYDVTNFYFETDEPDEDIYENETLIQKGLRKNGVSKENRNQPIVQMGLFMDNSGIPISYEIFPGNTLDHQTVKQSLKNSVDNMDFKRFIFVGDRGMCTYTNLLHLTSCGNGYVVAKSILKTKTSEREWIFDPSDYINEGKDFKYKSKIVTKIEKDENGNKVKLSEKVVVYWSKKFYDKEMAQNRSFLEFVEKVIASPNNFRITSSQVKSLKRFFKDDVINIKTGEVVASSSIKPLLDFDKLEEYKKSFGYYQIVSSELQMSEKEIIEVYHGLSKIEDQFRVMKGELSTRPIFVKTPEHIDAHLSICTIALIITRIIQKQIADSGLIPKAQNSWSFGMSAERIQNALNKCTVESFADDSYRFNNLDNKDLKLILDAFNISIPKKLFKKKELRRVKNNIQITNECIN